WRRGSLARASLPQARSWSELAHSLSLWEPPGQAVSPRHRPRCQTAPPGPAQGWRSRDRCWLVAVEELVDRPVGPLVEVLGVVDTDPRPVRAGCVQVEGEGAVDDLVALVEAAPDSDLARVAGQ